MRRIFAEKQALAAKGVPEGARKTVTALFSDIKGSTDLMQDLDPDEARAIVDPALSRMIEAVEQHGGYVVQSQGDGIFALFGAPVANEDHALQAIRAAIVMQESIVAYRGELTGQGKPPVEIRVGLNTGEMVLRSIPRGDLQLEYNAIGHAVNLAARIQTFASPGGIAVGEDTFKLAEGYFDFRSLGQKQVKGVRELVEIREVTGTGKLRSRFELAERRGLLPFVGRESELAVIRNAMHHAVSGRGQVVAVRGEPGLGKSRLFHEFKMTSVPGCEILETSCTSQAMAFPYVPLRELLTNYFDLAPQDGDEVWRQKIFDKSKSLDSALAQDGLYVCSLFGISGPEEARLRQTGPEVRQQLILDAVSRLLIAQSTRAPLVVIVEDLHWADSGTAEFLFPFAQRLAAHRILLLVNYRPEYQNRWKDHENATELNLKPLTNIETESLLSSMLGQASDARSTKDVVVALTEGNPFFVEELVRELLDKGLPGKDINTDSGISVPHNGITAVKVPTTVQGVLASRIDALNPSDKELLQRLSILGREFPLSLLQSFADRAESELQRELEQLQQSGFVYPVDDDARDGFKFKHSLTQQVAYNSMTADRRKLMHERAGRAIEEVFSNRIQDHYAELAYHYSNSANLDKAIDYLGNAGNQSVQIGAHRQAIAHFDHGLEFLKSLPSNALREAKELNLRFSLAAALWQSHGPTNSKLHGQINRVFELLKPESDPLLAFGFLHASVLLSLANAEYTDALGRCDRLSSFSQQVNSPVATMLSLLVRSNVRVLIGDLIQAQHDFEEGFALYESLQSVLWDDPRNLAINSLAFYGPLVCILGYPERAVQISEITVLAAKNHSTKYHLAIVTYFAGFLRLMTGDVTGARRYADEAVELASEVGLPTVLAGATVLRGWSLAHSGEFDDSIRMIRESIAEFERSTGRIWHATLNAILIDALIRGARLEEAEVLVDESIQFADTVGERVSLAELWRLKGIIWRTRKDYDQAERCLHRALAIAKEQGAGLFELRAVNNLASLWRDIGRGDEAYSMVSEIYGRFTEGSESSDLQEAKTLLEQLASGSK